MEFPIMSLQDVLKYEPLMEKLKVSEVARSERGFLTAYKKGLLNDKWLEKRQNFIKRTLVPYLKKPTLRRYISLIAWAYMPN